MDLLVRAELDADVAAVRRVHIESFPTAGEADLVDGLRAAHQLRISLVAEVEGALAGHVAFSPVTIDGELVARALGLGPLAVRSGFRRSGVGQALVRRALEIATFAKVGFVVVLGEPAYYGRFGFRPASEVSLRDEYEGGDAFQMLALEPGSLPVGGGLVQYAPQFAALEE